MKNIDSLRAVSSAPPPPPRERKLFGTDGIRGVANEHPMTPELALQLGRAVTFVAGRGKSHIPRILVGKDTRVSGYMLEQAIAGMLPKTKLGKQMYRKLKVYAGDKHPHQAQKPVGMTAV